MIARGHTVKDQVHSKRLMVSIMDNKADKGVGSIQDVDAGPANGETIIKFRQMINRVCSQQPRMSSVHKTNFS